MKCPNCGKEMEEGWLIARRQAYPFWTQQELRSFTAVPRPGRARPAGDDTTIYVHKGPISRLPAHYSAGIAAGCVHCKI